MGGGGSGGFSRIDLTELSAAANDRLRKLAETGTRILFVSETDDRKLLDKSLQASKVFDMSKISVHDSSNPAGATEALQSSSVVIGFTSSTAKEDFLNAIAEAATRTKKQGIHVGVGESAIIPSKMKAYRWPSMTWKELEKIFAA
ncbi:MAG: hypothetical protein K8F90_16915 [Hyphomicrobiales bacterium]|nr:hypothetical protein [Hyphomicrobiales bacterium]